MKLLIMGNNGHLGGLSVHYATLLSYLNKGDIELFCIHINDTGDRIFNNKSIHEIVVPYKPTSIFNKIKKLVRLYTAAKQATKFVPDIFIATGLGYGYALIASKLPKTTFKIFEEVHFEAMPDKLRMKMLKEFNAVAPQTQSMVTSFKSNVSDIRPVAFLPCFSKEYDVLGYKPIPPISRDIRIAYFGRLAWNKGLKEFIEFTAGVFKKNATIKLDIYGGGPEKENIQRAINDQDLNQQITLKGFYSDEEFPDLIGSYHAVILPSIATEGLPLILIEAMRYGRPVFTTTTGAMPEVGGVNKQGMLVSEKDKSAMGTNFNIFINKLMDNKFDATYINDVYEKNYSNDAFKNIWFKMLRNPKQYFQSNEL